MPFIIKSLSGQASSRADLIHTLGRLKLYIASDIEDTIVELLNNNRSYFEAFDLVLASHVLAFQHQFRVIKSTSDKLDSIVNSIFRFSSSSKEPPPSRSECLDQIAYAVLNQDFELSPEILCAFDLSQEQVRIEIALQCAEKKPGILSQRIQNFNIQNDEALGRIAQICAINDGPSTAECFQNFCIQSEEIRYQVAMNCMGNLGWAVARCIQNFAIQSEEKRIALAQICAEKDPAFIVKTIQNFVIHSEDARVQIARWCGQRDPVATAIHIQNFDFQAEESRFQIAFVCAERSPYAVAYYFKNFALSSEEKRVHLALHCARKGGSFAKHIKNFGIQSEESRVQVAMISAKDGEQTAQFIHLFEIQSEESRFQIAKACVTSMPFETAPYIPNFALENENYRFEIARKSASKEAWGTFRFIEGYAIHTERMVIELAKIYASHHNFEATLYFIGKIVSEEGRFQLAMIWAKKDSNHLVSHLDPFNIQSEERRCQIVKLLVCSLSRHWIKKLSRLNYVNPHQFSSACRWALRDNFQRFSLLYQSIDDAFKMDAFKALFQDTSDPFETSTDDFCNFLDYYVNIRSSISAPVKSHALQIIESIRAEKNPLVQKLVGRWLAGFLAIAPLSRSGVFEWAKWFIKPLSRLRDPQMRWQLTGLLLDFENDPESHPLWQKLAANPHWNLIAIPLFELQRKGLNVQLLTNIAQDLMRLPRNKRMQLNDKIHMRHLISTLIDLSNLPEFSTEQKENVLQRIFYQEGRFLDEKPILNHFTAVKNLVRLGKSTLLVQPGNLISLFESAFQELFHLKGYQNNFLETLNARIPNNQHLKSLMQYASGIYSLKNRLAIECLSLHIESLLDNTFLDKRYSLESHPHLQTLHRNRPDLLTKWREPLNLETQCEEEKNSAFDPKVWLKRKLLDDQHVTVDLELFANYCTASLSDKRKILEDLDSRAGAMQATPKIHSASREHPLKCKFQWICCKLFETPSHQPKKILKLLQELHRLIKDQESYTEFQHDLEVFLKTGIQKTFREDAIQAEILDDAMSLLHSGSDIPTCQRVDGNPSYNCCLLAYLMDGKIKMAAIKDKRGRIVARCMLKILWDGSNPVLFRERLYPDPLPETHRKILNNLTRQMAERLGIPLVSEDPTDLPYPHALQSLGSPAPFEYSDGGLNKVTNGTYTIPFTYRLM